MSQRTKKNPNAKWRFDYMPPGPIGAKFYDSNAKFNLITGPVGSGKTGLMVNTPFARCAERPKGINGLRQGKVIFIRKTYSQLQKTTIQSYKKWFPEEIFGPVKMSVPISHTIKWGDVELLVEFLAMDADNALDDLDSCEATWICIEEGKWINPKVFAKATERVGRYPPFDLKPKDMADKDWIPHYGVDVVSNPGNKRNWLVKTFVQSNDPRFRYFKQPSGKSPEAENIRNLVPEYYDTIESTSTPENAVMYLHGDWGDEVQGCPVYGKSWKDEWNVPKEAVKYLPDVTIYCGIDFGLTPAVVFGQRASSGQWRIFKEIVTPEDEKMSLQEFAEHLGQFIRSTFGGNQIFIYGDPAGAARDTHSGKTTFDLFLTVANLKIIKAPTNAINARKEAVFAPLRRSVNGGPGLILDSKCETLRDGFNSEYKYREIKEGGSESRGDSEPIKNHYSHVHDALQYLLSGAGEYKDITVGKRPFNKSAKPLTPKKYDIFKI